MTKLYSYIVARDYGFAPNPFYGYCTLATCKPKIRRAATAGDWVVGTGSKQIQRDGYLVYAMRVGETLSFDEYWKDTRFLDKRPDMYASKKKAFGDNIYRTNNCNGSWLQADSHHSLSNGIPNLHNIRRDTSADRVLISDYFVYFGGSGPEVPIFHGENIVHSTIGHRSKFSEKVVIEFVKWIMGLPDQGYCDDPLNW